MSKWGGRTRDPIRLNGMAGDHSYDDGRLCFVPPIGTMIIPY
ncbi:hypothetical protein [Azospirillum brasilense]|nr:hypothetical protein [Azospirillum brasilense]